MSHSLILVTTRTYPGGWAKAEDAAIALRVLRGDWRQSIEDYGYHVYAVHPDTWCCEVRGDLIHPEGSPPRLVHSVDGKKNRKAKKGV